MCGQIGTISATTMRAMRMRRPSTNAELCVSETRHADNTHMTRAAADAGHASTQDWGFRQRVSYQAGSRIASQLLRTKCHLVTRKALIISQGRGEDIDDQYNANFMRMISKQPAVVLDRCLRVKHGLSFSVALTAEPASRRLSIARSSNKEELRERANMSRYVVSI